MQSLFDPIEDIKLPEPKPPRDLKKIGKFAAVAVVAVALGIGGYFAYGLMFPKQLTERPLPPSTDKLLVELKDARDRIDSQTRDIYARIQQFNQRMDTLGRKQVSFSQVFLQGLSAEEEQALDQLVREEKDPSYRGILAQVAEDMKRIRDLQSKITELEGKLPGEGAEVGPGDTHMKLAINFLTKEHGIPETRARELVSRLNIMETSIDKGMRVHFYYDPAKDFFGTWVAQGDAKRSPLAIVRAKEMRLIQERDVAVAKASDLEEKKAELEGILENLKEEIAALEARKASLEANVTQLAAEKASAVERADMTSAELERARNSVYYEADLDERLRARGVLKGSDKVLTIADVKFKDSIDLRNGKSITLKPSEFGIARIADIRIVPTFLKEGRDLGVRFDPDGTVEVTVLNETALKGQKVLFVLTKD
jgi:predicted  nucleic acid-binding Zn-ribbon protein